MKSWTGRLRVAVLLALVLFGLVGCGNTARQPGAPIELFTRHWLEPIFREDLPTADEVGHAVALAATPGEYEPASLGVHTQQPLTGARFVASELRGAGSATIPASALDFKVTRYIDPAQFEPFSRWPKLADHPLQPGFLDRRESVAIDAGQSQQFWLTVHVPNDAQAGLYRGELRFEADGIVPLTLPLQLEVYPFQLAEARPSLWVAGDNWPLSAEAFADSRAHGMNTICLNPAHTKVPGIYAEERFSFPGMSENVDAVIRLAQQQGLGRQHPIGLMMYQHLTRSAVAALEAAGIKNRDTEGGFDDRDDYWIFYEPTTPVELNERFRGGYIPTPNPYTPPTTEYGRLLYRGWTSAFFQLEQARQQHGWPKLWYWLTDEPHVNRGRMRTAMVMAMAARDAKADTLITCNEPTVSEPDPDKLWFKAIEEEPELRLTPYLTIRSYNNAYLSPETLERTRDSGGQYGTYINIYGNQPASVRFQAGMLTYRLTLDNVMMWSWNSVGTDPEKGSRSTLREWEAVREGIDDLKYLEALERAIAAGQGSTTARQAAQKTLDEIKAQIPTNVRAVGFVDSFTGTWVRGKETWKAERFDALRRQVALAIAALR